MKLYKLGLKVSALVSVACSAYGLVLSNLPTPSLVIDMQSLRKSLGEDQVKDININHIALAMSKSRLILFPVTPDGDGIDYDAPEVKINPDQLGEDGIWGYVHTEVIRAKDDAVQFRDDLDRFLAEVDMPRFMAGEKGARPCLGLNNHHVGSYYWARSAGAGAAMEAPGVVYDQADFYQDGEGDGKGTIMWESDAGAAKCNSNDGKRSEWLNFLRKGDTIQLVPFDVEDCIIEFIKKFDFYGEGGTKSVRIFGVSHEGRPLGSEPEVVCEWRCG